MTSPSHRGSCAPTLQHPHAHQLTGRSIPWCAVACFFCVVAFVAFERLRSQTSRPRCGGRNTSCAACPRRGRARRGLRRLFLALSLFFFFSLSLFCTTRSLSRGSSWLLHPLPTPPWLHAHPTTSFMSLTVTRLAFHWAPTLTTA